MKEQIQIKEMHILIMLLGSAYGTGSLGSKCLQQADGYISEIHILIMQLGSAYGTSSLGSKCLQQAGGIDCLQRWLLNAQGAIVAAYTPVIKSFHHIPL